MAWSAEEYSGIVYDPFPTIEFGKHKGTPVKQLPQDYLRWMGTGVIGDYYRDLARAAAMNKPEPPEPMDYVKVYLTIDCERIVIDAPKQITPIIKTIPGYEWDNDAKQWSVPLESLKYVKGEFPKEFEFGKPMGEDSKQTMLCRYI